MILLLSVLEYMTVNLRLWLQILTPLTAASLVLRMIFMQILHDFGQTGNDMTDTKDSDFEVRVLCISQKLCKLHIIL